MRARTLPLVKLRAIIDLELGAIDGHDRLREQIEFAAQHDELAAHVVDRLTIVAAENRRSS
jgi:hypothetical protein